MTEARGAVYIAVAHRNQDARGGSRLKLVYVSSSIIPSRTANSVQVIRMCEAFAAAGHTVTLIAPHRPRLYEPGVKDVFAYYGAERRFRLLRLPWLPVRGQRRIYALLCGIAAWLLDADVVYGRFLPGLVWASRLGRKTIVEIHAPVEGAGSAEPRAARRLARSRRLLRVVAISRALAERVRSVFPWSDVVIAPDGAKSQGAASREGPAGAPLHVGYVGHMYAGRGVGLIVALAERMPDVRFTLVGGTDEDLRTWRSRATPANLSWRGHVRPALVGRVCREFDVLLMPYQERVAVHGGGGDTSAWMSPLKMFEYMAAGRPIVASDLPVLREVLRHGENALLVASGDVEAWGAAIQLLATDKELRRRLSETAQEDLETQYTWALRAERVLRSPTTSLGREGALLRRTRVLYILPTLRTGGAEKHVATLAKHLDREQFDPHVVCLADAGELEQVLRAHDVPVTTLAQPRDPRHARRLGHAARTLALARVIAELKPDILHAYLPAPNIYAALARLVAWPKSRLIVSKRALSDHKRGRPLLSLAERFANRVADRILVNSNAVADDVVRNERARREKLALVYNGVDVDAFAAPAGNAGLRSQFGIPEAAPVIVTVSNLRRVKGLDVLVAAARMVLVEAPDARFVIVGRDDGEGAQLRHDAARLGIAGAVHLAGARGDIPQILAEATLLVQPSRSEGFSNVILEGMAAGRPIVATDVGGNREAIESGATGLLVPPEDPEALARAILDLLAAPDAARRLGAGAQARARREFSLETMTVAMEALYLDVLGTPSEQTGRERRHD